MTEHLTPGFYAKNGFCIGDCAECERLDERDQAKGMTPEQEQAAGALLVMRALLKSKREEDR